MKSRILFPDRRSAVQDHLWIVVFYCTCAGPYYISSVDFLSGLWTLDFYWQSTAIHLLFLLAADLSVECFYYMRHPWYLLRLLWGWNRCLEQNNQTMYLSRLPLRSPEPVNYDGDAESSCLNKNEWIFRLTFFINIAFDKEVLTLIFFVNATKLRW